MSRYKYQSKDLPDKIVELASRYVFVSKSMIKNAFFREGKKVKIEEVLRDLIICGRLSHHQYRGGTCPEDLYWVPQEDYEQEKILAERDKRNPHAQTLIERRIPLFIKNNSR